MSEEKNNKINLWLIGDFLSFIAVLFVNYLGGSGYINNMSQQAVSNKYTTLITPAGFTFSIWGVIYTLILFSLGYLAFKRKDKKARNTIELISPLFIVSDILNMAWIVAFSYERIGISVAIIIVLLLVLMMMIEKIGHFRRSIRYKLTGITFTIYSAWVLIASLVNISTFLIKLGWNGLGISESIWTLIIIILAIIFVISYTLVYKNAFFPLSTAWAFFGIYSAYEEGVYNPDLVTAIKIALLAGIAIYLLVICYTFVKNKASIFPKEEWGNE